MSNQTSRQQQGGIGMQNQGGDAPARHSSDAEVEDLGGRRDSASQNPRPGAEEEE